MKTDAKQIRKIKKLCGDFYEKLQVLFDDMTVETYETECCTAAVAAQGYAEDARDADD